MSFEKPAVVIDNGSYSIKAGFACDNHPVAIFRTLIGRPNYLHGSYGRQYYDVAVGDDAIARVEDLELSHPVVNGRIEHWDNMERIWHHTFYRELKVAPEDRAVILACGLTATIEEKIKCCEVFFETLNNPAVCIQSQSVLAMYGSGTTTGICVDIGYDTTDIIPVYEGGMTKYAHMCTNLAGSQISDYLKKCLADRNLLQEIKSPHHIEDIKTRTLYVTPDGAMSRNDYKRNYKLSSDDVIDVSNEAFMAAELIFQPDLVKGEKTNIIPLHEAIVTASLKCDPEIRMEMYDAIVPCGGMAAIPGFNDRLQVELERCITSPFTIISSPEPYAVSWLGGATFAGLPDTGKIWVQKKQFEDYGERIVRNRFL
ncbi:actin-1-like [Vanessa cardui]|uniref:actin-1-like n=1 Tax=Vanessa cardui TaxID=171605 RepID=UPI001F143B36|nr:actin-1-like [Vanessa cardui]